MLFLQEDDGIRVSLFFCEAEDVIRYQLLSGGLFYAYEGEVHMCVCAWVRGFVGYVLGGD